VGPMIALGKYWVPHRGSFIEGKHILALTPA
jgi:hypothetical protein